MTVSREAILFITIPYEIHPFLHRDDLNDILSVLLSVAKKQERELIIRVHPLEEIGYYQNCIRQIQKTQIRDEINLRYSQGPGLEEVLSRSAVAVTYCSTIFLDCLHYHVPIVSFAWHDFSFKQQIEKYEIFHFAKDLTDLAQLLEKDLSEKQPSSLYNITSFLAETPVEVLRSQLADCI